MRTLEIEAIIGGGTLTDVVPAHIPDGRQRIVLVVDDTSQTSEEKLAVFKSIHTTQFYPYPHDTRYGRDEIYDEDGR